MQEIKAKIKQEIENELCYMKLADKEERFFIAKTVNELIRAWHNTDRRYYKKRRFKYADTDSFKKRGEVLKNGTNTEL